MDRDQHFIRQHRMQCVRGSLGVAPPLRVGRGGVALLSSRPENFSIHAIPARSIVFVAPRHLVKPDGVDDTFPSHHIFTNSGGVGILAVRFPLLRLLRFRLGPLGVRVGVRQRLPLRRVRFRRGLGLSLLRWRRGLVLVVVPRPVDGDRLWRRLCRWKV